MKEIVLINSGITRPTYYMSTKQGTASFEIAHLV